MYFSHIIASIYIVGRQLDLLYFPRVLCAIVFPIEVSTQVTRFNVSCKFYVTFSFKYATQCILRLKHKKQRS